VGSLSDQIVTFPMLVIIVISHLIIGLSLPFLIRYIIVRKPVKMLISALVSIVWGIVASIIACAILPALAVGVMVVLLSYSDSINSFIGFVLWSIILGRKHSIHRILLVVIFIANWWILSRE